MPGDNEEINTLCQRDLSQLDAVQAQQLLVSRVGRFASSFESRMLTFLLFSFHIRRTRGPRKMIFCICNYQSFVSVCAENNLGSVNIHRIIILIWHGVWLLDLQRFLRGKNRREFW